MVQVVLLSLFCMFVQSLWALAAAALFSVMAGFIKLCAPYFSACELVCYRSIFSVLFIASFVYFHHYSVQTPHLFGHIKRSFLGTFSMVLWFMTLGQIPLSLNMTLTYTTPLFMAVNFIVLAMLRHKKAPWGLTVSITLGFFGVVTTLQPSFGSEDLIPALICLAIALIDLATYWQIKELGLLKEPAWRVVFYFAVFGVAFGGIGALLTGGFHPVTLKTFFLLMGVGLCGTLAQICTTRSYAYGNMLLSSCLGFSAIVFSGVIGATAFADPVSLTSVAGMLMILVAGVFATIMTKQAEAQVALPEKKTADFKTKSADNKNGG